MELFTTVNSENNLPIIQIRTQNQMLLKKFIPQFTSNPEFSLKNIGTYTIDQANPLETAIYLQSSKFGDEVFIIIEKIIAFAIASIGLVEAAQSMESEGVYQQFVSPKEFLGMTQPMQYL